MKKIERCLLAEGEVLPVFQTRQRFSWLRFSCYCLLSIICLLVVLLLSGFFILSSGVDSAYIRDQAQKNIAGFLSEDGQISVGSTRISLDHMNNIVIEARDVTLADARNNLDVERINSIKLGLSPLALLSGDVEISSVEVSGAEVNVAQSENGGDFLKGLPLDAKGRVDFAASSQMVFNGVNEALALLAKRQTKVIRLADISIKAALPEGTQHFLISHASIENAADKVIIDSSLDWQDHVLNINGSVLRQNGALDEFKFELDGMPLQIGSSPKVKQLVGTDNRANPAHFSLSAQAGVVLSGQVASADHAQKIAAQLKVSDIDFEVGRVADIRGQADISLELADGTSKIEILPSLVQLGGVKLKFNGALGAEGDESAETDGYRFEVVTSEAVSAPAQSTEPPLSFGGRVAGRYDVDDKRLEFSNLDISTSDGSLYGQGSLSFGQGSPGIIFMLRVPEMPVAQAKQLWPVDVADGARDWVLKNLFGGRLSNGRIDIAIPPGHFNGHEKLPELTSEDVQVDFDVQNTRLDVIGELPPLREADGHIKVRGSHATIDLEKGTVFTSGDRRIDVSNGTLFIPWGRQRPVMAELALNLQGDAAAVTEILGKRPINIARHLPFEAADIKGDVNSRVQVEFAVNKDAPEGSYTWAADIDFKALDIAKPIDGQLISQADGKIKVDPKSANITATALLNNLPAKITMVEPVEDKTVLSQQHVELTLNDKARASLYPEMNDFFTGTMVVKLGQEKNKQRNIVVDLKDTAINLSMAGWKKGAGIPAKAEFTYSKPDENSSHIAIRNLNISGDGFQLAGDINIDKAGLASADFIKIQLTKGDNLSSKLRRIKGGYGVDIKGSSFDARALIKQLGQLDTGNSSASDSLGKTRIVINGQIDELNGYHSEKLKNFALSYEVAGQAISSFSVNASTGSGKGFVATSNKQNNARSVSLKSSDAGSVLRFFDLYDKLHGGEISVGLAAQGNNPLNGQIDARNFSIIGEGRLSSIVSSSPTPGGTSLNQAVKRDIDVSRVDIERGYALVEKGEDYASLSKGVIRGPVIGTTFQGTLYDGDGNMNMTGTFMPAYGLNRLFADIPLFGALLGNGRDRGLIGITYKLSGLAKSPKVTVNPISVIAPGIFRTIFEF